MQKVALTIAGSDPSGGAGLQADLKTFLSLGVYGMAMPAALTAQSASGVTAVKAVPPDFMEAQLETLFSAHTPDALKTGMLHTSRTIETVANAVRKYRLLNLVVDPVMVSSSGRRLLNSGAVVVLIEKLLPLAELVTPNLDEAGVLAGMDVGSVGEMEEAARAIKGLGPRFVLVKGGHLGGDAVDVFFNGSEFFHFSAQRVQGKEVHGAGCVYSAAITAGLAKEMSVMQAISEAKEFVTGAIKNAAPTGEGRAVLV